MPNKRLTISIASIAFEISLYCDTNYIIGAGLEIEEASSIVSEAHLIGIGIFMILIKAYMHAEALTFHNKI